MAGEPFAHFGARHEHEDARLSVPDHEEFMNGLKGRIYGGTSGGMLVSVESLSRWYG
jgi:hypothetical protein